MKVKPLAHINCRKWTAGHKARVDGIRKRRINDLPHPRLLWPHNELVVVVLWRNGQVPVVGGLHGIRMVQAIRPGRLSVEWLCCPIISITCGLGIESVVSEGHQLRTSLDCPSALEAFVLPTSHTCICGQIYLYTVVSTRRSFVCGWELAREREDTMDDNLVPEWIKKWKEYNNNVLATVLCLDHKAGLIDWWVGRQSCCCSMSPTILITGNLHIN